MSTLLELRNRFYNRFDEQGQAYIDVAQANGLINEGAAQLHNWLVSEGESYVWQESTVPLVAKQADYPLPTNFLKMLKVFSAGSQTNGAIVPIPRLMPQEYRGPTLGNNYGFSYWQPRGYMIVGQNLRIVPTPASAIGGITYWWAPQFKPLVLDTDTTPLSMFIGSQEFIVNHAVIGAHIKEESDTTALERRQAQIQAMIQQTIINRDMGQHVRAVDVEGLCR